ncbi:ribosomal RNA small subunit methyltransferase A [Candidatus Peregrinibacteria bacterium]|nr:MAG: ribosomal RNA small subunit methyltransferase A [Candidatus Peregrinibacteria bacterium]
MGFAKKSLGQNFLHDESVLQDILKASDLSPTDRVLEIGPGQGFLTRALIEKAGHVTALELDGDLIPWLKMDFGKAKNFDLIHTDALKYQPASGPYKLVANIPYYITSPILNHFLLEQFRSGNPPTRMVLMVQREVAEKIVAKDKKYSLLSLEVQLFGKAELVRIVPPTAFKPRPKVDSAVLKIDIYDKPLLEGNLKQIFWLFKVSFAQKRKKLSNNLRSALKMNGMEVKNLLHHAGLPEDLRAEDLNWEQWQKLFNALGSHLPSFAK